MHLIIILIILSILVLTLHVIRLEYCFSRMPTFIMSCATASGLFKGADDACQTIKCTFRTQYANTSRNFDICYFANSASVTNVKSIDTEKQMHKFLIFPLMKYIMVNKTK